MTYNRTFKIQKLPTLPNAMRSNWQSKFRKSKEWVEAVMRAFIGNSPEEPLARSKITITRVSSNEPDKDNNYASVKPVLDALKKNRIIVDDNPKAIELEVTWKKGRPPGWIEIKVEEVSFEVREVSGEI